MRRSEFDEPRREDEHPRDAEPRPEGEFYREEHVRANEAPEGVPPRRSSDVPPAAAIPSEARTLGMLCHLVSLSTLVGVPGILSVLVIWLVKRDDHPFIDAQGKEALNFNITVWIGFVACIITVIGILLAFVILVAAIVLPIVAGLKASDGISYRYPLTIRLVK